VLFALALAPSGWLAWKWREMPHLGLHQDDALYLVSAKSLAEGRGYRIESLPGRPFQTKYPPMLSVLMAPVWRFGPGFPDNLKLAMALAWLSLPVCLLTMRVLFRQFGLGPREAWLLTLAAAWHPIVGVLSTAILSDLLFLSLFLGGLLLAEKAMGHKRGVRLMIAGGLLGGAAYLTRSAALPIAITVPICCAWRGQMTRGLWFLAGMLPAVVGWQLWSMIHMLDSCDPAWLYYTNYLALQRMTVRLDDLAQVLWYNADALLRGLGKLLLFDVATVPNVHVERILGAGALAGAVRLARRTGCVQYPAAALGLALLLLIYFFTADERLCLPLYPLALMGFWTEVKNFGAAVRKTWERGQGADRVLAIGAGAALSGAGLWIAGSDAAGYAKFLPAVFDTCRRDLEAHQPAYDWIRMHTPAEAMVNAYDDPVLYLYTGRRALGMPMPSSRVYSGDAESEANQFIRAVPQQAREHGLDYLLATDSDFYRERRAGLLWRAAAADPLLRREYADAHAAVYRLTPRATGSLPLPVPAVAARQAACF
jgi:hypothetical protein